MFIHRELIPSIEQSLFQGKVIIIYGARRTGKTTLVKHIADNLGNSKYINCELLQYKTTLETTDSNSLKDIIGTSKLLILDEAQSIRNIGLVLKIIVDTYPEIQVIATGSSGFDLANKTAEPLTGRSRQYILYPFSATEILQKTDKPSIINNLNKLFRFGLYPEVYQNSEKRAIEEINNIASNYLYKDILQHENIRKPELIINLLRALALQLGNEVSLNELAQLLNENTHTIKRYLDLLEKTFVIYKLSSFSRNLRKELGKSQKIYFIDIGIRNALIQNFNPMELRNDIGAIWENFCIIEKIKSNHYKRKFVNSYFWRTYDQKEIDYIEEEGGKLHAFELKFSQTKKTKIPKEFLDTYKNGSFEIITKDNFYSFIQ
ncbi:MAG: ATP-binding protein [Bacteroidales bacterium]|nr:ATP-binding protein [Bacteroidales bacterium]